VFLAVFRAIDFYDIEDEMVVKITAIGHKVHSDLFVRGKKVEL